MQQDSTGHLKLPCSTHGSPNLSSGSMTRVQSKTTEQGRAQSGREANPFCMRGGLLGVGEQVEEKEESASPSTLLPLSTSQRHTSHCFSNSVVKDQLHSSSSFAEWQSSVPRLSTYNHPSHLISSHVCQVGLKFNMQLRMTMNFCCFCLHIPDAGITVCLHAQFKPC